MNSDGIGCGRSQQAGPRGWWLLARAALRPLHLPGLLQRRRPLRQRIEEAALNASALVVVTVDVQGRICSFNTAAQRLTGHSQPEVLGRSLVDLLLPAEGAAAGRAAFTRLAAGTIPSRYETDWVTRDGQLRHLAFVTTGLPNRTGQVAHLVAAGIDLTSSGAPSS
jgi:PAS domain S-box-containing protein